MQGSHRDWKIGEHFPVREKSGTFVQTAKAFFTQYTKRVWKLTKLINYKNIFSLAPPAIPALIFIYLSIIPINNQLLLVNFVSPKKWEPLLSLFMLCTIFFNILQITNKETTPVKNFTMLHKLIRTLHEQQQLHRTLSACHTQEFTYGSLHFIYL